MPQGKAKGHFTRDPGFIRTPELGGVMAPYPLGTGLHRNDLAKPVSKK